MEDINEYRGELIRNQTDAEKSFKKYLKKKKEHFIFQHIIDCGKGKKYIADFYLPKRGIVVEIDGGYHYTEEQIEKDETRTRNIEDKFGYKVVRIPNFRNELIDEYLN